MSQSPMRRRQAARSFEEIVACDDLYRRWRTVPDFVVRFTGAVDDFERMCHHDNLLAVAKLMRAAGERAAGLDGRRLSDFSISELADCCRVISRSLLNGAYRRLPVRVKRIPKSDGVRVREIQISQCLDAVVSKMLQLAITPAVDGILLDGCIGYRPCGSLQLACARLARQILITGNQTLVQFDVADMFPSVDRERLQGYLAELFPDQRLVELLGHVVRGPEADGGSGLRQGDATSPALLNVYLHHELDTWLSTRTELQHWGRWSDDIWALTQGDIEAKAILRDIEEHLKGKNLKLKELKGSSPITDLSAGETARLLGVNIECENGQLTFSVPDETYQNFRQKLRECYNDPDPQTCAIHMVRSWISAYGHALPRQQGRNTTNHILATCGRMGFHDFSWRDVQKWISSAWERWELTLREQGEGAVVRHPRAPRFPAVLPDSDFNPGEGDAGVVPFDANERLGSISQGGFEAHWERLRRVRHRGGAGDHAETSAGDITGRPAAGAGVQGGAEAD